MPFSISEIVVSDTTQKVVALNWTYENADGKVGNQWQLSEPYGDTPLADCTEATLADWLVEQLPNTSEDFDKQIADNKARAELQQTLRDYTPHPDAPPTPVVMLAP
jgi:hypothetical protein